MASYTRANPKVGEAVELKAVFLRFGEIFDPASVGPVLITRRDPRDPLYVEATDLLETIPASSISRISVGVYQYTASGAVIDAEEIFHDTVAFTLAALGPGDSFSITSTFRPTLNAVADVGYITAQDITDEGVVGIDAELINKRIEYWTKQIEVWLGRWFEPRQMTLYLDGTDRHRIFLRIPIIAVDGIGIDDRAELPLSAYRDAKVYNRHISGTLFPDDRENPKIEGIWLPQGSQNIRIRGTFGYTEPDLSTPCAILRALTLLVIKDLAPLSSQQRNSPKIVGTISEEKTEEHSYKINSPKLVTSGVSYYSGDREIDLLLQDYRRPFEISGRFEVDNGLIGNEYYNRRRRRSFY